MVSFDFEVRNNFMEQKPKDLNSLRIGLIQQKNTDDINQNFQYTISKINELAAKGVQVIVLQELFLSLYFPHQEAEDNFDLAEPIPGLTTDVLSELALKHDVVIVPW